MNRYCIAHDHGRMWRVYDDVAKKFAEPMEKASFKYEARTRADQMNKSEENTNVS